MRATLAQLEAFHWIARLGSFHAAARHLHVTQPTISARIVELERLFGTPLFKRNRQGVELTARGRGVIDQVANMLRLSDDIAQPSGSGNTLRGLLRLGAVESVGFLVMPKLLKRFVVNFPDLKVELTMDVGSELSRKLNVGELDVAILTNPTCDETVTVEWVGKVAHAWVAGRQLRLPRRHIRPSDLQMLRIFTTPNPSTIAIAMANWFASADIEPEHVSRSNSLALISRLVAEGIGVAVLPPALLRPDIDSGLIRVLTAVPAIPPGDMALAYGGPPHRYRGLVSTIIEELNESSLLRPF